ncbi:MAG: UDP-N-acetylmuramate--L-alanine ligase [Ruminococcaceae bacterium]|nr:UDP-N-acetylmuramate--L-alanine ligase [Oscillospiraceae bacterium]
MSGLAEVLSSRGFTVRGSDMNESETLARLRGLGIQTFVGHVYEQAKGADIVIRTSAIPDSNPEIVCARDHGIPVLERAEAWGILMEEYRDIVCFSGTHGKTTSTSMMTHIALKARLDPQVMVGANLSVIGGGMRIADSDLFIAEACEYCNSFHHFRPTVAVILNVDEDHLDFFSGIEDIIASFHKFASIVPKNGGCVVVNADDPNAMRAVCHLDREILTFGIENSADVRAENIVYTDSETVFDLVFRGEILTKITLSVLGKHNVYNALSACTAALKLGVSPEHIAAGLSEFTGAGRRFEPKGAYHGAKVYDDYAHHPSEVRATLGAVKALGYDRVICIFQPHTYTRTAALKEEFAAALSLADQVCMVPIYAAREKNTIGIASSAIADLIPNSLDFEDFDTCVAWLSEHAKTGDLVLTMGAGDVYKIGEMLLGA